MYYVNIMNKIGHDRDNNNRPKNTLLLYWLDKFILKYIILIDRPWYELSGVSSSCIYICIRTIARGQKLRRHLSLANNAL
jgi:hypothetical protein